MAWPVHVVTLFPDMFPGPLGTSLTGRALDNGLWSLTATGLREFAFDKHHSVDDEPFGGGAGMLMRPDVVGRAIESSLEMAGPNIQRVFLSPRGERFTQQTAKAWSQNKDGIMLVCGRFEGLDQRVIDHYNLQEVSIGDFVMTGGEIAACAMIDACVRLLPNVIGKQESLEEESFSADLLEYPQYTRPQEWNGHSVPDVLVSGHHGNVHKWRVERSEQITKERRPDLWELYINRGKVQ